jgi:hypothetical protein
VTEKYLHIITHDVPYPADFGGVIDCFYKLKSLHAIGVKIKLHCFTKKRPQQDLLEKYCHSVNYYPRNLITGISLVLPYIISTRKDNRLLDNLSKDNYPILFEGIHTTYHLYKNHLKNRKVFLRILNVETIYYQYLAKNEKNILKKLHFQIESLLIKKYEKMIANKSKILALSTTDQSIYSELFEAKDIIYLPPFLPDTFTSCKIGCGNYCLYQGNLAVNENEKAALWLMQEIFSKLSQPLVIAGSKPSKKLINTAKQYKNISVVESPSEINMKLLIENAQINILPSFNNTGIKFKLINALFNGRHCMVNFAGVEGSGLNDLCTIVDTPTEFQQKIKLLFKQPFTQKEMQHRSTALRQLYNNEKNALLINEMLP